MAARSIDPMEARDIAYAGFNDALGALSTVELLEAANRPEVLAFVNEGWRVLAYRGVRDALLTHLVIVLMRAYGGASRAGDRDVGALLRALVAQDGLRSAIAAQGSGRHLGRALMTWEALRSDSRCREIKSFRDKHVAHMSKPEPTVPLPRWGALFDFVRAHGAMCDDLARGCGCGPQSLAGQVAGYARSATAFWDLHTEGENIGPALVGESEA